MPQSSAWPEGHRPSGAPLTIYPEHRDGAAEAGYPDLLCGTSYDR